MKSYETKIHLAKNNQDEHACKTPKTFQPKLVTRFYTKVTCVHCLRIVESLKRAGKLSLTEALNSYDN